MSLCVACFGPVSVLFYLMFVWMIFKEAEWPRFVVRTAH